MGKTATDASARGSGASGAVSGPLARIRGVVPSLQPAERKVADYVLANSESILAQSVGEVAMGAQISEATVIRFCRTAGFSGFQNLKISLAREHVSPLASAVHQDITEKDKPEDVAAKVFHSNIESLKDTMAVAEPGKLSQAAEVIGRAARVLVIGVGTSAPGAFDAYAKLMRIGVPVTLQTDAHLQMMEAALLTKKDAVLAISHSGATMDPVETARVAKATGAAVVCITNNALSPLARISDIVLLTASRETLFRAEALSSRIAQATIIDILYVMMGLKNRKRAIESAKKIEDVITSKQY
ncbi:MAG: MurR/RpiR family transcriptional regulator [Nitrospinota bacterium]|nr:MurR/RpiR family transcriptional regulator [Nitrospinota bacterium]